MAFSPEFKVLLHAIRDEVESNTNPEVQGPGIYSHMRNIGGLYQYDCFYSGEHAVPYEWNGNQDFKLADMCMIRPGNESLHGVLVASGAALRLVDRTHIQLSEAGFDLLLSALRYNETLNEN